jgi:hypothetical protein
MKTINVEYPTVEDIVIKTKAEAMSMGYKNAIIRHQPVNRPYNIVVKQVKRLVQEEFMSSADYEAELEAQCRATTGMGRSVFQVRFKRAWNE